MPKSRRKPVARYHDRVANQYDHIYDDAFWQWHDALTWDYLKTHLPADQSLPVIDLGCGTGKWGLKMAQSGFQVTCLDISHKMLEAVRRKVEDLGLEHRVDCVQADLDDLSALPREHYGLATAFGEPLCSTPSPPRAVKQIHRILRPQGRVVATIDNRLNALDFHLERGDVEGLQSFLQKGATHWLTREHDERFALQTYTPEQAAKLFGSAHFEVLELLGKTVLPMRQHRELLQDRPTFRRLLSIEKKLARTADAVGRAAHIQIAARREDR